MDGYEKQSPQKPPVKERPEGSMDLRSEEVLNAILKKSVNELTKYDKAFLKARRGYLKPSQLIDYKFLTQTSKETVKKKHVKTK